MGDDVNIIVPPQEETEQTYEEIGQELVDLLSSIQTRLDNLVIQIGEQNARIALIEGLCTELGERSWAEVGHGHEDLAPIGHDHPEHAAAEHTHETPHREKDVAPEKQHIWYRKLGT